MTFTEQDKQKFEKGIKNIIRLFHQLKIPVVDYDKINGVVYNPRLQKVVARCVFRTSTIKRGNRIIKMEKLDEYGYTIEISTRFLLLSEKQQINILAHELLHTVPKSIGHDEIFRRYMNIANNTGYFNITVYANGDEDMIYNFKYIIKCQDCGNETGYYRKCDPVINTNDYRCMHCKSVNLKRIK